MLGRASSDAGTRMRRSKSTSAVHRQPPSIAEPLPPEFAQQQALAAATAAYARAQVQDGAGHCAKRSSDITRSKSSASRKSLASQGSHFPPRESSFRASKVQKTGSNNSSHRQTRASTMNTEQFPPFCPIPSSEKPNPAARPLSAQPSMPPSAHTGISQRQSASSSISSQQIRKARSMYYASSVQTGSPIARPPAKYLVTPPTNPSPAADTRSTLPLGRTLRPSPLAPPRIPITMAASETVDQARDKYLQGFQQKTVKHKPSMFLAPFKKRQENGTEKARRSTSRSYPNTVSDQQRLGSGSMDPPTTDFQPCHGPKEKRSFSGSLKNKFKHVFRRTSNRSPTLPVQQIDASRDYFSNAQAIPSVSDYAHDIPSPDETTLQRVRSRTPSSDAVRPALVKSGSRASSNGSSKSNKSSQSLHSDMNAAHVSLSRVTSWGTSSNGDTVNQRAMKRLTVIHEAKDSIGSEAERIATMVPRRKSLPPLAAFRDPMPVEKLMKESLSPVDPKRVFSALMREIDASEADHNRSDRVYQTPGADSDIFESSTTKELHTRTTEMQSSASRDLGPSMNSDQRPSSRRPASASAHSVHSKTSTIRSIGRAIRSTIRTVTPTEQHSSAFTTDPVNVHDHVHGLATPTNTTPGLEETESQPASLMSTPSAAQIESRVTRSNDRGQTPLEDADKLQFLRTTERTCSTTDFAQGTTPFAISRRGSNQDGISHAKSPLVEVNSKPGPPESPKVPVSPASRPLTSPLSPSIYSRNTDGNSILPNDSVMSFSGPDDLECAHTGGSAVILNSQSVRSYVIGTPSPRRPEVTRTSRDWKAWLSYEISGMETISQEDLTIHEQYVTPSGRHRSESGRSSHTEHDDTTVILRESSELAMSRPDLERPNATDPVSVVAREKAQFDPSNADYQLEDTKSVLDKSQSYSTTSKELVPVQTPSTDIGVRQRPSPSLSSLTSTLSRQCGPPTPSNQASPSQLVFETPRSARMNERFPYIRNTRRSSNNSAASSRHSKSPTESVVSLMSTSSSKATPSPRAYSNVSAPASSETAQRIPNVALKRNDAKYKRKENIEPPLIRTNSKPNNLLWDVTSRPLSVQPFSSTALTQNIIKSSQHTENNSSPAATPHRGYVRASLRPISPEKLARRPRSAFDLRGTKAPQGPLALYQTNMAQSKTLSPRPASELRRPALHFKTSSGSLAQAKEPSPITEDRVIDSVLEDSREGSVTPGQRMADRFLQERKSTGVLDSGKMRGGLRLVREDTPAFL